MNSLSAPTTAAEGASIDSRNDGSCACPVNAPATGVDELCEPCAVRRLRNLQSPGDSGIAIVDFDETLFLPNSTVTYLEALRPRWLAAAVIGGLKVLRPWRWVPSWRADPVYHDYWLRILVTSVLMPWSLPR